MFVVKLLMYHLINMTTYVIGQKIYMKAWSFQYEMNY
jgi:hypothetical protein